MLPQSHFYHVYSAVSFGFYYFEYSVSVNFVISLLINPLFQTIYECVKWHRFYLKFTGNPPASLHCKNGNSYHLLPVP